MPGSHFDDRDDDFFEFETLNRQEFYCPRCRVKMNQKVTKVGGTFYGCPNYPVCHFSCDTLQAPFRCASVNEIQNPNLISLLQKRNNADRIHAARKSKHSTEDTNDRRVSSTSPTGYSTHPSINPAAFHALVKRVEQLEEDNKKLRDFISQYEERQKKIGFEIE